MLALAAPIVVAGRAQATSWHLASSFGHEGIAGLPLREGPANGQLIAAGPHGSIYVGGFARHEKGAFLVARLSATGRLVESFGSGGVRKVPAIRWNAHSPPRIFAVAGGKLLVAGLDANGRLTAVRLNESGRDDPSYGKRGIAEHPLPVQGGHEILTAANVQPDGELVAVFQREAPQPVNEPAIPFGLGEGEISLVHVLGDGALDSSFGTNGFLTATGKTPALTGYPGNGTGWACEQSVAADGSSAYAYEQAVPSVTPSEARPAVLELGATGLDAPFGSEGTAFLPSVPVARNGTASALCDGLVAVPGGAVVAAFGGEGGDSRGDELLRFTAAGTLDPSFAGVGHTRLGVPVAALALGPAQETYSAGTEGRTLIVGGTLAAGTPDPALGGAGGKRLTTNLTRPNPTREAPGVEVLAANGQLDVRVGEELVRAVG
jgi:hypothetical protein